MLDERTATSGPAVIEVAITPLRWDVPAQTVDTMVAEAVACLDAGMTNYEMVEAAVALAGEVGRDVARSPQALAALRS
jgi:hypothetical protein